MPPGLSSRLGRQTAGGKPDLFCYCSVGPASVKIFKLNRSHEAMRKLTRLCCSKSLMTRIQSSFGPYPVLIVCGAFL